MNAAKKEKIVRGKAGKETLLDRGAGERMEEQRPKEREEARWKGMREF